MENILFDQSKPLHHFALEPVQYRLKVQQYSNCPSEFTIQRISFERDLDRYLNAYHRGQNNCFPQRKGSRVATDAVRSEESLELATRRAKKSCRQQVTELAPDHFVTFTTRETGPEYFNPDQWASMWGHFVRLVRQSGAKFEYVGALERHPTNPDHLHLHVAWRGHCHYGLMRRFWHIAICALRGIKITKTLRGPDAPGGILDRPVKAARGSYRKIRKIATYMAKYMTKDVICEFNKKRYWPSKGITLQKAQVYYLNSLTQLDAMREGCLLMGQWDEEMGMCPQKLFMPSERLIWCAISPELTPGPPF